MTAPSLRPVRDTALETGNRHLVPLLFRKHLSQCILVERNAVTVILHQRTLRKALLRFLHSAQFKESSPAVVEVRWGRRCLKGLRFPQLFLIVPFSIGLVLCLDDPPKSANQSRAVKQDEQNHYH
jgi:hypothetical protein